MARLVIEALPYEKGKAYGYQEFLMNFLNYLYSYRLEVCFDEIVVICLDGQQDSFCRFSDKFSIKAYKCDSILKRLIVQSTMTIDLRLTKVDVILFTGNYSSLIKRAKHILIVHDLLFKRKQWLHNKLIRWQRSLYLPMSLKLADKVVAISFFTARDIEHYYPFSKNKIEVIYNYFNFSKFGSKLSNLKKEAYFLSVCSSAYHKNTIHLFDAFQLYVNTGGIYSLHLVGKISENIILNEKYNSLSIQVRNRIVFHTNITDEELAILYMKAQCYISCSLFEGLGMPIVEAMFFGLPLLLTDGEVFREVSANKAIYIDPNDSKMLAEQMHYIEKEGKSIDYQEVINNLYSEINTSAKYLSLINSFANN